MNERTRGAPSFGGGRRHAPAPVVLGETSAEDRTLNAGGKRDGYGLARALTRENSVPGQLTRKGMSSLSWGSARAPPDASRRPQRTKSTGPPGPRLRAPPPPSSILHRRSRQPPTQPPLPQRRGGEEEEEAAGLLKRPGSPGPNRRHVSFRRAGLRRPCPRGPPATVSGAGGVSTSGVTGQALRKPG